MYRFSYLSVYIIQVLHRIRIVQKLNCVRELFVDTFLREMTKFKITILYIRYAYDHILYVRMQKNSQNSQNSTLNN